MVRAKQNHTTPPPGFSLGRDIDISSWHTGELVTGADGGVRCFLGYRREQQPDTLPWYAVSVALHDKYSRTSFRFVELRDGIIQRSGFLRDEEYYKRADDRSLNLPRGADSYFGVTLRDSGKQDDESTRAIFGATMVEFLEIARALAKVAGRSFSEWLQLPRLTFSKTRENACDVTGCLIPKNFPYVAFDEAQYHWSHVSLYGLSKLLSFMCPTGRESPIARAILDSGVSEGLLTRLLEIATSYATPLYPDRENW